MSKITVKFSQPVVFTEGLGPNGVTITHDHAGTFTLSGSGATGSGTDTVAYEGAWDNPIIRGDIATWTYSGGDYEDLDGELLPDSTVNLSNCSGAYPVPVYGPRIEVAVIPTEPVTDGCYLKVVTLHDPGDVEVVITCNGSTYKTSDASLVLSQYGHAWKGEVLVTGLTELKYYPWTVTQGSYTDEGQCNRLPVSGEEHTVIMFSCDNNTNLTNKFNNNPYNVVGNWPAIKRLLDDGVFISMIIGIDDYSGYVDQKSISDTFMPDCSQLEAVASLENGGDEDDVSLSYLAYYGCLGTENSVQSDSMSENDDLTVHWGRETNRAYCRKMIPRKTAEGDHEYQSNDIGFNVDSTGTVTPGDLPNTRWVTYPTAEGRGKELATEMVDTAGLAFCDDRNLEAYAHHWVKKAGNIRFFALDHITHGTGDAAAPAEIPVSQMTHLYGENQLDDARAELASELVLFNIMCLGTGIMYCDTVPSGTASLAQNPIYNFIQNEFEYLLTNDVDGLAGHANTNGTSGVFVAVSGDLHRRNVLQYQYDATVGNDAFNFEHWHTGTINGSSPFKNTTGYGVGDTYNHTNTVAHATVLHDEERDNDELLGVCSFIVIKDLPDEAVPTMRMQHYNTNGKVAYSRDYAVGSNYGS